MTNAPIICRARTNSAEIHATVHRELNAELITIVHRVDALLDTQEMPALLAKKYQFGIPISAKWTPIVQVNWPVSVACAKIHVMKLNRVLNVPFVRFRTPYPCAQCTACAKKVTQAMQRNNVLQNRLLYQVAVRTLNALPQKHAETECVSTHVRSSIHAPEPRNVWLKVTRPFARVRSAWWAIHSRTVTANQWSRSNAQWIRNVQVIVPVSTRDARTHVPKVTHAQEMQNAEHCTTDHCACVLEAGEEIRKYNATNRNVKTIMTVHTIRPVITRSA